MKRLNRKGFTLIELLAVIIILGVLMIIAIPSVTTYIQNSRKSAWVDTAVAYAKSVVNKVNEGGKLQFFTEEVLYMVPVGHKADKSCVSVESGGQSPFSDSWRYAYVGVIYNGKGYDYYFIGEDGAGQGIEFVSQRYLNENGVDKMYSVTKIATGNAQNELQTQYNYTGTDKYTEISSATNNNMYTKFVGSGTGTSRTPGVLKLEGNKATNENEISYSKVIFVHASGTNVCEYTPS